MNPITVTAAANPEALENLLDAAREHNYVFSAVKFDAPYELVTFTVEFPENYTADEFAAVCREYELDELVDLIES